MTAREMSFLEGGGELGAMMRAHDWSATPLGNPAAWPRSLKTAVRIMLTSRQPFWLGWGPELTYLYNDPYQSIIGGKHPHALGRPFSEVWSEIWDIVGPMADTVMKRDEGTYVEEQLLIMQRHGYEEETYYTFSYSPVPNDDGGPGGLICANTDDTGRVIGERQLSTLSELASRIAGARNRQEACRLGIEALGGNARDIPFALIYLEGQAGATELAAATGGTQALIDPSLWPIEGAVSSHEAPDVQIVGLKVPPGSIPMGAWNRAPQLAAVLPIRAAGQGTRRGALVVGLNPFRQVDEKYRSFLELVARQLSSGIANAYAYEEERRRAEALEQLDQAKTAFFSNVSHEFRTPLTLMLGPLEDLLARERTLSGVELEKLQLAHRNALRLLKLVNTLLDFSRVEAGRMQASYEAVDLPAFTAELASLFRSTLERAGLRFEIDCPPAGDGEPAFVDRGMWEKIVFNLLSNAFKFTFHGSITMRVRRDEASGNFLMSVSDTGTGIPAAPQAKRSGDGDAEPMKERLASRLSRRQILVVDDNRDAARSLSLVLGMLGADVHLAHDGVAALEAVERVSPSVVLLDIGMPGMDGYEVARRIRASAIGGRPVLVALTGWGQDEDKRRSSQAGFDHHITKPIDLAHLENLLSSVDGGGATWNP